MTPDLVELPLTATVADAFAEVRRRSEELPLVYEIFIVEGGQLKGMVTLKDLVLAVDTSLTLTSILREVPATVRDDASVRDVARAASKYNLLSVPVVDESGVLKGMVTVDDILAEVIGAA
jgi:magnesium transporter